MSDNQIGPLAPSRATSLKGGQHPELKGTKAELIPTDLSQPARTLDLISDLSKMVMEASFAGV
jgi:hypothetical protein